MKRVAWTWRGAQYRLGVKSASLESVSTEAFVLKHQGPVVEWLNNAIYPLVKSLSSG